MFISVKCRLSICVWCSFILISCLDRPTLTSDDLSAGQDDLQVNITAGSRDADEQMRNNPEAGNSTGSDPIAGDISGGEPVAGELVGGEPVAGEPVAGELVGGEPVAGEPVAGELVAGDPVAGDPVAGEPVAGEPVENTCGNGILERGERCDDGNMNSDDGCDDLCQIMVGYRCYSQVPSVCEQSCGNNQLDSGELCDGDLGVADCTLNCQLSPSCGNGWREEEEGCDDGNQKGWDGCDAGCNLEPDFNSEGNQYTPETIISHTSPDALCAAIGQVFWLEDNILYGRLADGTGPIQALTLSIEYTWTGLAADHWRLYLLGYSGAQKATVIALPHGQWTADR